jgi:hypothetical protein
MFDCTRLVVQLEEYCGAQRQHIRGILGQRQGGIAYCKRPVQFACRQQQAPQLELGFKMFRVAIDHLVQEAEHFLPLALALRHLRQAEPGRGHAVLDLQGILEFDARLVQVALCEQFSAPLVELVRLVFGRRAGSQTQNTGSDQGPDTRPAQRSGNALARKPLHCIHPQAKMDESYPATSTHSTPLRKSRR